MLRCGSIHSLSSDCCCHSHRLLIIAKAILFSDPLYTLYGTCHARVPLSLFVGHATGLIVDSPVRVDCKYKVLCSLWWIVIYVTAQNYRKNYMLSKRWERSWSCNQATGIHEFFSRLQAVIIHQYLSMDTSTTADWQESLCVRYGEGKDEDVRSSLAIKLKGLTMSSSPAQRTWLWPHGKIPVKLPAVSIVQRRWHQHVASVCCTNQSTSHSVRNWWRRRLCWSWTSGDWRRRLSKRPRCIAARQTRLNTTWCDRLTQRYQGVSVFFHILLVILMLMTDWLEEVFRVNEGCSNKHYYYYYYYYLCLPLVSCNQCSRLC